MDQPDTSPENSMTGRRIGAYRLEEEIGRGGMGAVYRAQRVDGEFDQTVAVKLIKRGMDTDMILRRFRRERQILASLNHPNVAYFLGGGSTEDGLPYFVMEYIDGLPLYKYCNHNKLSVRDRLAVFRQVCWAVAAAHEIQVIHRDLKPSNIMVKDDGKPKLLDFGIAKMLDPDLSSTDAEPTATQMRAMTPEYASPEQISGEPVGAASDIYSLGVILFELLTGHRPYRLRRQIPDEVARVIREEMPTNPSGTVTSDHDLVPDNGSEMTIDRVFEGRNTTPESLKRELSGDLDKIILKALRKDPADRYRTVMDLADDITNYLEGRPVKAEYFVTRASLTGLRKAAGRSIAILPFNVMSSSSSDTGSEFVGIGMADALISRLSGVPRIIVRPTTSVLPFGGSNPYEASRQLGVDFVLDGNVRVVGGRIRISVQLYDAAEDTTAWARVFDKDVGDVLELEDSLAEQVSASLLPQLSTEERDRLARRGTNKPEAYEAYIRGRYFWSRFSDEGLLKAVAEFKKAIEIDPNYAQPYIGLADYYIWSAIFGEIPSTEGFPMAMEAARKALEVNDSLGEAYAALAFGVFLFDWNWADAEYLVKRAIDLNPNYSFAHECYSNFLVAQGRFDEGIREIRKAEELDPISPRAIMMTAWTLYQCRRYDEAVAKARKAYAMSKGLPQAMLHLGNNLTATGELDEAISILRKSAEAWGRSGLPRYMLAHARAAEGNLAAAKSILAKLLKTAEQHYMKPYFIGMTAVAAGEIDLAFEYFRKAVEEKNEWMMWFATDPKLDVIRSDPRYTELLKATGNPITQQSSSLGIDTSETPRSIAVLPFKVIKHSEPCESDEDYLSIGLADSVTMRLSNVRKFIVRPTSSVMQTAATDTDPFNAGDRLGVEFVVDGIIRHVGDGIRVTAQLLDVKERSTLWSASFHEKATDLLELEDSIASQVAKSLLPRLTGEEAAVVTKRGTTSPEAHDAYLQGRFFWNQLELESFPKAIAAFRRAVELDPEYALAHVGIADYYTWASIYGIERPEVGFPRVFESANRALDIDGSMAEAYAALGLYYSNAEEWQKSEEYYRKGLEINPNYPLGHEWLAAVLVGTGRFHEGVEEVLLAEGLDPLSLRPKVLSAWTLYQARQFEAAEKKARELESLNPNFMQAHLQAANVLLELGDFESALHHARRAAEIEPDSPLHLYVLAFALVRNGLLEEANEVVGSWTDRSKQEYVNPYLLGLAYAALGDRDHAIELIRQAIDEKNAWILWLGTEPKLDAMREDDRYKELLRSTKNPIFETLYPGDN
jgi:serine/threonine protein kinase/tetratricopeptide (TPR) repeat protein